MSSQYSYRCATSCFGAVSRWRESRYRSTNESGTSVWLSSSFMKEEKRRIATGAIVPRD